ncbi:MAG TPA: Hsp20/alpha crystallin family protein [Gemmatimonadales bacterium]|jgi:HSP20 family protein|nr:Hsp20/alpha crystallin family protein [Gemmatimonadales bacterium]
MTTTVTRRLYEVPDFFGLRGLNRLFDEGFANWGQNGIVPTWIPATDVSEDKEAVKIQIELPGVKAEDIKLSLENQTLTIRGEKKQVAEEKSDRLHRYERTFGSFERVFALPNSVDPEKVQAAYEAGVLTVTLPKAERARQREIPVSVK